MRKFNTLLIILFSLSCAGSLYAEGGVGASGGGGGGAVGSSNPIGGGSSSGGSSDTSSGTTTSTSTSTTTSDGSSGTSSNTSDSSSTSTGSSSQNSGSSTTSGGSSSGSSSGGSSSGSGSSSSGGAPTTSVSYVGWCGIVDGARFDVDYAATNQFSIGLLFPDGIEPGDPQVCEAPSGNTCWYVDAAAPDGGDGSFTSPYNTFDVLVGYEKSGSYHTGQVNGGDYIYLTGTFKSKEMIFGRGTQGGSYAEPTVIKSYRGQARAVFDGEFQTTPITIRANGSIRNEGIVVQNIEIKNAKGRGISVEELVANVTIAGVEIHDTAIVPGSSTSGAIQFRQTDSVHNHSLCNSLIYANHRNSNGVGFFTAINNNIGGIGILSETSALDGSKVTIKGNTIHDEIYSIRHKHSGNIITEVYSNYLSDSYNGFYLRAYKDNIIHHNVMYDMEVAAVKIEQENQNGDMNLSFYNNTVMDAKSMIRTGNDNTAYAHNVSSYNNIFYNTATVTPYSLGPYASVNFPLTGWSSSNNLYYTASTVKFLVHQGVNYGFNAGTTVLGESNSLTTDPQFKDTNPTLPDLRLESSSPAKGSGVGGVDLGAF
ncbi:MAG: hypothetical protein GKR93_10625 [Gammaproteobacteria bacterium]|nr:hypothetical protein [Gammaproteobacteria bacterium]